MTKQNAKALAYLRRCKSAKVQAISGKPSQPFPWYNKDATTRKLKSKGKGGK